MDHIKSDLIRRYHLERFPGSLGLNYYVVTWLVFDVVLNFYLFICLQCFSLFKVALHHYWGHGGPQLHGGPTGGHGEHGGYGGTQLAPAFPPFSLKAARIPTTYKNK